MTIQEAVKEVRQAMGMTQEQFAKKLNLTVRTILRYEKDLPPRGAALLRFAEYAEDARRSDLAFVFRSALIKELEESGTTRPAFEGLLKQYFAGILARIKDELAEYDSNQDPETASAVLATIACEIDWKPLEALFVLADGFRLIRLTTENWRKTKDPVGDLAAVKNWVEAADRVLEMRFSKGMKFIRTNTDF